MTKARKSPEVEPAVQDPSAKPIPREVSQIGRLVSRWNWCEADQNFCAEIAETDDAYEAATMSHHVEQAEIERELCAAIPKDRHDVRTMLGFVRDRLRNEDPGHEFEFSILDHIVEELLPLWHQTDQEAEARGRKQAEANAKSSLQIGFETDRIFREHGVIPMKSRRIDTDATATVEKAREMIYKLDRLITDLERPRA